MKEFNRVRSSDCGSFIVDRRGTILGFDLALEELTGWPAIQVVGRNKDLAGTPLYAGEIRLAGERRNLDLCLNCKDGRVLDVEVGARPLSGPGERTLIQILRVVSLSTPEAGTDDERRRDPLTALPNAEAFAVRLAAEFSAATASARPLALVLADVDHLREINDRLGHEAGDEVLRRWRASCASAWTMKLASAGWARTISPSCCRTPAAARRASSPPACARRWSATVSSSRRRPKKTTGHAESRRGLVPCRRGQCLGPDGAGPGRAERGAIDGPQPGLVLPAPPAGAGAGAGLLRRRRVAAGGLHAGPLAQRDLRPDLGRRSRSACAAR